MNKKIWILAIISVLAAIGIGIFIYSNNRNSENQNNYQANRTSVSENNTSENENKEQPSEEQISTFSTKIISSDPSRQHNIELTCNRLNGTIVKNGDTFSFYETLGPSTKEKGYLEADILEKGKDAAVSYGNYDLKFRNNSGNDIKIVTLTDGNVVTATLMSIK